MEDNPVFLLPKQTTMTNLEIKSILNDQGWFDHSPEPFGQWTVGKHVEETGETASILHQIIMGNSHYSFIILDKDTFIKKHI